MVMGEMCSIRGCDQRACNHLVPFRAQQEAQVCVYHYEAFVEGGLDRLYGGKQALEVENLLRSLCTRILDFTEEDAGGCRSWTYYDVREAAKAALKEVK